MNAVDAARELLPVWVVWTPLVFSLVLAAGVTLLGMRIAGAITLSPFLKLKPDVHWTERNRLAYPTRVASFLLVAGLTSFFAFSSRANAGPWSAVGPNTMWVAALVAVMALSLRWYFRVQRRLGVPPKGFRQVLKDVGVHAFLMGPEVVLALGFAWVMPPHWNVTTLILLCVALGAAAMLAGGMRIRLARVVGLVAPPPDRLKRIVRVASERTGVEAGSLVLVEWSKANAFALPIGGHLGVTRRAMDLLTDEELAAVCAHELGHVSETTASKWIRAVGSVALTGYVAAISPIIRSLGEHGELLAAAGFLFAVAALRRFVRRKEQRADRIAGDASGSSAVFGGALEKMYRDSRMPAVGWGRKPSHPHLYDRLKADGLVPDYPRPAPPSLARTVLGVSVPMIAAWLALTGLEWGLHYARNTAASPRRGIKWAFLLAAAPHGGGPNEFRALGYLHHADGDHKRAVVFYRAAIELDPGNCRAHIGLATSLGHADRCDQARAQFITAEKLNASTGTRGKYGSRWRKRARKSLNDCERRKRKRKRPDVHESDL